MTTDNGLNTYTNKGKRSTSLICIIFRVGRSAACNSLRARDAPFLTGACILIGLGGRVVEGVGTATLANVGVACAKEIVALCADGEV